MIPLMGVCLFWSYWLCYPRPLSTRHSLRQNAIQCNMSSSIICSCFVLLAVTSSCDRRCMLQAGIHVQGAGLSCRDACMHGYYCNGKKLQACLCSPANWIGRLSAACCSSACICGLWGSQSTYNTTITDGIRWHALHGHTC